MNTKQVIIMRKDLSMRRGKEIAQGAHASMAVLTNKLKTGDWKLWNGVPYHTLLLGDLSIYPESTIEGTLEKDPVHYWFENQFAKIGLSCDTEAELLQLYKKAQSANLPCALITDSGRTEFNGNPTNTCIAIGPWHAEDIDKITGHLKLR